MRFKKSTEEEPTLAIAALIDVVFLLLIFFLLTYHFDVASGLPIRLPGIARRAYDDEKQKIVLVVDRENRLYLKGEQIAPRDLEGRLKQLLAREGPSHLLLQADREVKHGLVVQVMDIAKTAGVHSVVIAANWEPERAL
jgi:biopolymer transport protein ExbD